ncbi:alpha/beta-hydrolase [Stipitochalara longipes BDJ]|nr:alpha/beta-hydrolase [Stipitochalara longipes BDJ]
MDAVQCRDCVNGAVHTGKPTGDQITYQGLPTYVSRPDEGTPERGIIIFIPDIFGWEFPNSRLLADKYAKKGGYTVYIPDFMRGYGAAPKAAEATRLAAAYEAPSSLLYTIFVKPFYILRTIFLFAGPAFHTRPSKSKPIVLNFMRSLRADSSTANSKIGVVGFCWGGQYAVLLAQDDSDLGSTESRPLVDAAFTAHPARFKIPDDIEKVKAPLSMALAERDLWVKPAEAQTLKRMEKVEPYEVVIFEGTKHGFALRNNEEDEVLMAAAEKAEDQALFWFKRWIG